MMRALWLTCVCVFGCSQSEGAAQGWPLRAPMPDPPDALCLDVGDARVCWRAGAAARWPRALPDVPAPPEGFRCAGHGEARVCEPRAQASGPIVCTGGACVQERPRQPDLGEWECVEQAGVVVCRDRGAAAGIARGPLELGWTCGARRGGGRVCVDLDPDRPAEGLHVRCRRELDAAGPRRRCVAARDPAIGDRCRSAAGCPAAMSCMSGLCLPARPAADCWLDGDCAAGARCRWGTCQAWHATEQARRARAGCA